MRLGPDELGVDEICLLTQSSYFFDQDCKKLLWFSFTFNPNLIGKDSSAAMTPLNHEQFLSEKEANKNKNKKRIKEGRKEEKREGEK